MNGVLHRVSARTLLTRLIESPDLIRVIRALDGQTFSTLVRRVGVEDAGEIVALATTEQLVAAFDEDLFSNDRPGEREVFDHDRFSVWLDVLLEAGDEVAALRFTELSEDFVVRALSSVVLVLDHDALLTSMNQGGEEAVYADKALESCISEELDGYLLVSRNSAGWDSAMALVMALDRNHRDFLVRILDRCSDLASDYVDDLEALTTVLSGEDSLAEDVEAEREERRGELGYVEPRAARSFLSLAKTAPPKDTAERDPVTRAYLRGLRRNNPSVRTPAEPMEPKVRALIGELTTAAELPAAPLASVAGEASVAEAKLPIVDALRGLSESNPDRFNERMEEIGYLTNVLIAGASSGAARLRASEAADAALATVALGAELMLEERGASARERSAGARKALQALLEELPADMLFRKASSSLATAKSKMGSAGFLRSTTELAGAVRELRSARSAKGAGEGRK